MKPPNKLTLQLLEKMKKYIVILPLLICLIHNTFAQNMKSEKEVDAFLDNLMQAYNAYDGETIKSLMTDDAFAIVIQEGMVYKPDLYDQFTLEMADKQKFTRVNHWENKSYRIVDDQSAVALCEIISTTTIEDQEPFQTRSINTVVFEKINGKWKIITMHTSSKTNNRNF